MELVASVCSAVKGLVQHQARKGRESLCGVRLAVGHVGECREQGAGSVPPAIKEPRSPEDQEPGEGTPFVQELKYQVSPPLQWPRLHTCCGRGPVPRSDGQASTVPCHPGLTGRACELQLPSAPSQLSINNQVSPMRAV